MIWSIHNNCLAWFSVSRLIHITHVFKWLAHLSGLSLGIASALEHSQKNPFLFPELAKWLAGLKLKRRPQITAAATVNSAPPEKTRLGTRVALFQHTGWLRLSNASVRGAIVNGTQLSEKPALWALGWWISRCKECHETFLIEMFKERHFPFCRH